MIYQLRASLSAIALLAAPLTGPLAGLLQAQSSCSEHVLRPASAGPHDGFGYSFDGQVVALAGARAAVAAPSDSQGGTAAGAVYTFEEVAGQWSDGTRLATSSVSAYNAFGTCVALDGDVLAVGAPSMAWDAGQPGRVLVFERGPSGWQEVAILTPHDSAAHDRFGVSLALEGDRIVVGATLAAAGCGAGGQCGAAYVFERSAGAWVEVATLAQDAPETFDQFGSSVALAGDRVAIGCVGDRHVDAYRRGAVYVFEGSGGAWTRTARLDGDAPYVSLGEAVALSGDDLAVGAPFASTFGGPYPGAVYVWRHAAGAWTRAAALHPTPGNDRFGHALALAGDALVVAAPTSNELHIGVGRVHLYGRDAAGWAPRSARRAYGSDWLGNAVALDAGRLLIADSGGAGEVGSGRAHVVPLAGLDIDPFCFCTSAGCHNEDAEAGCANGTGAGCRLTACGSTSLSRDDLVLTAENTGAHSFGLFFMGRTATALQFFGNGRRCVDDPVQLLRFPARPAGAAGIVREGPGLAAHAAASFPAFAHVMSGQRWNFQLWYRDGGACLTGYNVSNALGVTFTP